jgi:hypothetical protein
MGYRCRTSPDVRACSPRSPRSPASSGQSTATQSAPLSQQLIGGVGLMGALGGLPDTNSPPTYGLFGVLKNPPSANPTAYRLFQGAGSASGNGDQSAPPPFLSSLANLAWSPPPAVSGDGSLYPAVSRPFADSNAQSDASYALGPRPFTTLDSTAFGSGTNIYPQAENDQLNLAGAPSLVSDQSDTEDQNVVPPNADPTEQARPTQAQWFPRSSTLSSP